MQMKRWPQPDGVWQVSCSRCGHAWQERTARSFVDTIMESRLRAITAVGLLLVAACFTTFAGYVAWMLWKLFDLGRPGVEALALLFVAALTFTVGAAHAWRTSIDGDPACAISPSYLNTPSTRRTNAVASRFASSITVWAEFGGSRMKTPVTDVPFRIQQATAMMLPAGGKTPCWQYNSSSPPFGTSNGVKPGNSAW